MKAPIVVVAGVTASGKTGLALQLAHAFNGELVGADSVQVYRGFDIGSAKPTREELGGVAHHLIDVIDPTEAIDAAHFARLADAAIDGIHARGKLPIVVGGTGLWLRALVRGLVALPEPDPAIRGALEARVQSEGTPALHAELVRVDPKAAAKIHPNDALRVVRALEVFAQTGQALGELRDAHALGAPRYQNFFIALDRPRDVLRSRIEARTRAMLTAGFIDEVAQLRAAWPKDARAFGSVGYREVMAHLEGTLTRDQLEEEVTRSTWVYARRQRTWFQSEPGVHMKPTLEDEDVTPMLRSVESFLRAHANAR